MNDNTENNFYKSFFAVLAGVFSAIAAGFVIKMVFEKVLHFDLSSESFVNKNQSEMSILFAIGAWLLISSFIGGFVCAIIAGRNDLSHIIISSLVVLALYFLIGGTEIFKAKNLASWIVLLTIPIGYFTGEWMGTRNRKI